MPTLCSTTYKEGEQSDKHACHCRAAIQEAGHCLGSESFPVVAASSPSSSKPPRTADSAGSQPTCLPSRPGVCSYREAVQGQRDILTGTNNTTVSSLEHKSTLPGHEKGVPMRQLGGSHPPLIAELAIERACREQDNPPTFYEDLEAQSQNACGFRYTTVH